MQWQIVHSSSVYKAIPCDDLRISQIQKPLAEVYSPIAYVGPDLRLGISCYLQIDYQEHQSLIHSPTNAMTILDTISLANGMYDKQYLHQRECHSIGQCRDSSLERQDRKASRIHTVRMLGVRRRAFDLLTI